MGARLLLDLLYKSELVDRDSLLVALLLAELPTEEEIKRPCITYSVNQTKPTYSWAITDVSTIIVTINKKNNNLKTITDNHTYFNISQ